MSRRKSQVKNLHSSRKRRQRYEEFRSDYEREEHLYKSTQDDLYSRREPDTLSNNIGRPSSEMHYAADERIDGMPRIRDGPEVASSYNGKQYYAQHQYQQPFCDDPAVDSFFFPMNNDPHRVHDEEHNQFRNNSHSDMYAHSDTSVPQYIPPLMSIAPKDRQSSNPAERVELVNDHESHFWSKRDLTHVQSSNTLDDIPRYVQSSRAHTMSGDDHPARRDCYDSRNLRTGNLYHKRHDVSIAHSRVMEIQSTNHRSDPLANDPSFRLPSTQLQTNAHAEETPVPLMSLFNEDYQTREWSTESYERQPYSFSRLGEEISHATDIPPAYYHSGTASLSGQSSDVLCRLGDKVDQDFSNMPCSPDQRLMNTDYRRDDPGIRTKVNVLSRLGPENEPRNNDMHIVNNIEPMQHPQDMSGHSSKNTDYQFNDSDFRAPSTLPYNDNTLIKSEPWLEPKRTCDSCDNDDRFLSSTDMSSRNTNYPQTTEFNEVAETKIRREPSSLFSSVGAGVTHSSSRYSRPENVRRQSRVPLKLSANGRSRVARTNLSKRRSTKSVSGNKTSRSRSEGKSKAFKSHEVVPPVKRSSNRSSEEHGNWLFEFAEDTVGDDVAKYLLSSKDKVLLVRLHSACVVVMKFLSEQKKLYSKSEVLQALGDYFLGFLSNDLISTSSFPNSAETLFKNEVHHLRMICGVDRNKWRDKIVQFESLSATISNALKEVTITRSKHAEEKSVSPQPLVMDLNTADAVGYTAAFFSKIESSPIDKNTCNVENRSQFVEGDNDLSGILGVANLSIGNSVQGYSERNEKTVVPNDFDDRTIVADSLSQSIVASVSEACPVTQSEELPKDTKSTSSGAYLVDRCTDTVCTQPMSNVTAELSKHHSSQESKPIDVGIRGSSKLPCVTFNSQENVLPSCSSKEENSCFQHSTFSSDTLAKHTNVTENVDSCVSSSESLKIVTEPMSPLQQCAHYSQTEIDLKYIPSKECVTNTPSKQLEDLSAISCPSTVNYTKQETNPGSTFRSWSSFELEMQNSALECSPVVSGCKKKDDTSLLQNLASNDIETPDSAPLETGLKSPTSVASVLESSKTDTARSKRDDLSPGEIVSTSPSPSPPPPPAKEITKKSKRNDSRTKTRQRENRSCSERRDSNSRSTSNYTKRSYRQLPRKRKGSRSRFEVPSSSGRSRQNSSSNSSSRRSRNLESDEEIELLDLRKKALISMIEEKKSSPPRIKNVSSPSGTDRIGEQDSYVVVDMEICDDVDMQGSVDSTVCTDVTAESVGEYCKQTTSSHIASNTTIQGELKLDSHVSTHQHTKDSRSGKDDPVSTGIEIAPAAEQFASPLKKHGTKSSNNEPVLPSIEVAAPFEHSTYLKKCITKSPNSSSVLPIIEKASSVKHSKTSTSHKKQVNKSLTGHVLPKSLPAVDHPSTFLKKHVANSSNTDPMLPSIEPATSVERCTTLGGHAIKSLQDSSFVVKILPGNEKTWNIDPVHIMPHSESESEDQEYESQPLKNSTTPVSEISQFLIQARNASEEQKNVVRSRPASVPNSVPSSLSALRKKEYLQLKKKLEMHERKKGLIKRKKPPPISRGHVFTPSKKITPSKKVSSRKTKPLMKASSCDSSTRNLEVARLSVSLKSYEKELTSYRKEQNNNFKGLTTLGKEVTQQDQIIEEYDLKVLALETQLERLKDQIQTAKTDQAQAEKSKLALQAKVKLVKDHVSDSGKKITLVESQIQKTKSFLSRLNIMPAISTDKALISLKTYKKPITSKDSVVVVPVAVDSKTQNDPVSDCDAICPPRFPTVIEVEPVSDGEVCENNQPVAQLFEEVSEPETPNLSLNCCDKSSSSLKYGACSQLESVRDSAEKVSVTTLVKKSPPLGDSQSVPTNNMSLQTASLATELLDHVPVISAANETQETLSNKMNSCIGQSCTAVTCHVASNTFSASSNSVKSVLPVVHSGLFTLQNEPPFLPVTSRNSFNVVPTCINNSVLEDSQHTASLSHSKYPEGIPASVITQSSQRSRKQRKPTKRIISSKPDILGRKLPNTISTNRKSTGVASNSKDDTFVKCEESRKRKQSFQNSLNLKRANSISVINKRIKLCVSNSTQRDSIISSTTDKAVVVLQQAFKSITQDCQPLVAAEVQGMLLAASIFPGQISNCTSSHFSLSVVSGVTNDYSRPSVVKLPATLFDVPSSTSCTTEGGMYTTYSSPLLGFSSYLLNPAYRQQEKLQLGSVTYSNSLDPSQVLCKFELLGVCKDPTCSAQHIREVTPSNKDVVSNLVTHAPQIAQFVPSKQAVTKTKKSLSVKKVSMECISTYSSSVVDRYSSKLSDEEIYRLIAHKVVKAKHFDDPKYGDRYFVTFSDSGQFIKENSEASQSLHVDIAPVCKSHVELNECPLLAVSSDDYPASERRYFKLVPQKPTPAEDSVNVLLKKVDNCVLMNNYADAMTVVNDGLKKHVTSVELWLYFLRLHYHFSLQKMGSQSSCKVSLNDACTNAFESSKSYAVLLKCIDVGTDYSWKQRWISKGLESLSSVPFTSTTSHESLELLLNSALLSISTGRVDVALGTMERALFGTSKLPHTCAIDLSAQLTLEDKQSATLFFFYVLYWRDIPSVAFNSDHVPSQLVCKVFSIHWVGGRTLSVSEYDSIDFYFKEFLCLLDSQSKTQSCLPLLVSMVGFEATHGDYQKVIKVIELLVEKYPTVAELWMLLIKTTKEMETYPVSVIERSLTASPRNAWLYYTAARIVLSPRHFQSKTNPKDNTHLAVQWLGECVMSFYKRDCPLVTNPLFLYRKLLGQMVPYTLSVPSLADGIDTRKLGSQVAPLWMCYCLLVELIGPSDDADCFHHTTVDAFEAAIHSLLDRESSVVLWREYMIHLRLRIGHSTENLNAYLSCTKRCLQAIDYRLLHTHTFSGQTQPYYEDYSFHNEIIDMFINSVQCTLSQKLSLLQSFGSILPNCSVLTTKIVKCAMEQEAPRTELAQSLLAAHLEKFPSNVLLWKMAVSIEKNLKRIREVRWMYQQATDVLPQCLSLWTDFLMFEVNNYVGSLDADAPMLAVRNVLVKARRCGVDLYTAFNHKSMHKS